jgi:hypothetical protein
VQQEAQRAAQGAAYAAKREAAAAEHARKIASGQIVTLDVILEREQGMSRAAVLGALINEAEISIASGIVDNDDENVFDPTRPQYTLFPTPKKMGATA